MTAWTTADKDLAVKVVDAVRAWPPDKPIGGYALGRHIGLNGTIVRVKRAVQHVMPLAVEMAVDRYPGKILSVERDGRDGWVYRLRDNTDNSVVRVLMPRVRKARTAVRRARYEAPIGTPEGRALERLLSMAEDALSPEIIDVIAEAMRYKAEEQAKADSQSE